jgi:hypothetical protein
LASEALLFCVWAFLPLIGLLHKIFTIVADIMTMKILREIQRDASPPPLSVAIPSKLYHEKKSSPISTVDFERMEEMKLPDAMGLIQIVHRLEPTSAHRVGEKQGTFSRSKSFEGNAVVKPIVLQHAFSSVVESSATKPPLRPRPSRGDGHSRSGSDSSGSEAERQGEQAMMNLADDCLASGDIKTAVALYESLKKELEKKYGIFHASVAQCLDKIGGAQLICGKFELATENLEKAISIQCGVLGIHHLDVGCSMEKLATAKMQLRQVHDAHELYRRALRIKRSRLGLYHQDVAHIQTQLACIYFHCGEILGAQAAFEESLHAYRHLEAVEQHSSWTVKAADALCSIGSIKLMQRNHTRAIGYFAEALRVSSVNDMHVVAFSSF